MMNSITNTLTVRTKEFLKLSLDHLLPTPKPDPRPRAKPSTRPKPRAKPSIKAPPRVPKKRIPKKVKNDSWDKYIGVEKGQAKCIVCKITTINSKDFEAGHIISDKNGGGIHVNNIMPICGLCNKSMSAENMDSYIAKYYPENLEYFNRLVRT